MNNTAPKMKFSIKIYFSKCDQIRRICAVLFFKELWKHLQKSKLQILLTLTIFQPNLMKYVREIVRSNVNKTNSYLNIF